MEKSCSKIRLEYNPDDYTYYINWDIPHGVCKDGPRTDFTRMSDWITFPSAQLPCTKGPFHGSQNYFQFFLLVRRGDKMPFVFAKITFSADRIGTGPIMDSWETYDIVLANVCTFRDDSDKYYSRKTLKLVEEAQIVPCNTQAVEKEGNCKTISKWLNLRHGNLPPVESITRLAFKIRIKHKKWSTNFSKFQSHLRQLLNSGKLPNLNLRALLFSPNYSDITIFCGEREYPAHRIILSSKSVVLRTMLCQPMVENLTGKLTIEDFEPEIVEEFLRYIYTNSVINMTRNAEGLFLIAEKYDVQHLKTLSETSLMLNTTNENVLERYTLGQLFNSEPIMARCVERINLNKTIIWRTQKQFSEACQKYPELIYKVLVICDDIVKTNKARIPPPQGVFGVVFRSFYIIWNASTLIKEYIFDLFEMN